MKYRNIMPTEDNVMETFFKDIVGRNADIFRFCQLLNMTDGPYAIAVDGAWGSGKTFFIKQIKMLLDCANTTLDAATLNSDKWKQFFNQHSVFSEQFNKIDAFATVYFDAWANDNDNDPLIAIMYTILQSYGGTEIQLKELLNKALLIADVVSGHNISAILKSDANKVDLLFDSLKKERLLHEHMDTFIREAVEERGNKLIIFIDELDRCKPTYAVKLLERVKHFLVYDQVIVVYSVNVNQLQHTIKACYGQDFDATRYLQRFFDQTVNLPKVDLQNYYEKIMYRSSGDVYSQVGELTIKYFGLELREIANYFEAQYSQIDENMLEKWNYHIEYQKYILVAVLPIMIGLNMFDKTKYNLFLQGEYADPLVDIFINANLFDYIARIVYSNIKPLIELEQSHKAQRQVFTDFYYAIFAPAKVSNQELRIYDYHGNTKDVLLRAMTYISAFSIYG